MALRDIVRRESGRQEVAARRPRRPFLGLTSDFDDLFERFFQDAGFTGGDLAQAVAPRVDVKESDDEVVVEADLPGVEEKNIEVSLHDGLLTVKAERQESAETKAEEGWHRRERVYRSYHRVIPMPAVVDPEKVQASYKAGVLRVQLPKAAEARPRKIEVRAS
jgi:HSP20 family protein